MLYNCHFPWMSSNSSSVGSRTINTLSPHSLYSRYPFAIQSACVSMLAITYSKVINVVNRHLDQAITTEFELEDKQFSGPIEVTEVNGPDIKAENSFDKSPVKPVQRQAAAQGKTLRNSFAPHSYTMIRAKLA